MVRLVASLLVALCLTSVLALAQSDTATVSGLVTDSKGAVLVGAQVRAVNVEAGTRSTAFTNQNGVYVHHNLRPGQYRLVVDNQGFRQIVLVGLVLSAQDAVGRNFTMQIGSVIESLTITATGQAVNISPAVGTVVNPEFVENLPLNGRSFQSLIGLTPGVDFVSSSGALGGGGSYGEFSVNGQRTNSNYFTVDGVSANFATTTLFVHRLPPCRCSRQSQPESGLVEHHRRSRSHVSKVAYPRPCSAKVRKSFKRREANLSLHCCPRRSCNWTAPHVHW